MEQVSPAWFSALAQASHLVHRTLSNMAETRSHQVMESCWKWFESEGVKCDGEQVPAKANEFWDFYGGEEATGPGLQRDITKQIEEARAKALLVEAKAAPIRKARLVDPLLRLQNRFFAMAVRL